MTRSWDGASRKKLCTARASRQAGTTLVTKKQARALLGPAGQQPTVVARARAMPVNRPGLVNGVSLAAPSLAGPRRRPMSTQGSPPGAGSDAGRGRPPRRAWKGQCFVTGSLPSRGMGKFINWRSTSRMSSSERPSMPKCSARARSTRQAPTGAPFSSCSTMSSKWMTWVAAAIHAGSSGKPSRTLTRTCVNIGLTRSKSRRDIWSVHSCVFTSTCAPLFIRSCSFSGVKRRIQ
mmetsp:Transcript_70159/g.203440  ORF Transcript_70159/g.203440 Transcript_70159/m.203440 type:complete len:234 (+) Transcript_70159:137-838(+)